MYIYIYVYIYIFMYIIYIYIYVYNIYIYMTILVCINRRRKPSVQGQFHLEQLVGTSWWLKTQNIFGFGDRPISMVDTFWQSLRSDMKYPPKSG